MMKSLLLTAIPLAFPACAYAFIPALQSFGLSSRRAITAGNKALFAEHGPPQYEKIDAVLRQAEVVGEGSVILHLDTASNIEYEPGHVLALEIQNDTDESSSAEENGGSWMRGPYTVSRATENSIDILVKVVGDKSKRFASAAPGTPVRFGGKFKVPIIEGIQNNKDTTKRVVLLSTGVGAGPCVGAIEKALAVPTFPPVELFASYRTAKEIVYGDYLDQLAAQHPDKFKWNAVVSSEVGRISATVEHVQAVAGSGLEGLELTLNDTHYHLIGNGQMVNEWKTGLAKAGVPDEKVTTEMYFNHKALVNDEAVDRIASVIAASCRARAFSS
jgi:ferredoxin-NADP reductase